MQLKITVEDRLEIVKLYHNNKTTKEIYREFPQYSIKQLAAIRAHIGMGTYEDPEDVSKY